MNMALTLTALLSLSINSAHAAATQFIDCHFQNPASTDHVVISLTDPQTGSFYYTTGVNSDGNDQDTGRIGIVQEDSKNDTTKARFVAKWMTVQDGSKVTVEFHFSMPKSLVFKTGDPFKTTLTTNILDGGSKLPASLNADDDLTCIAKLKL
jgi:hypothetical protein